MKNSPCYNNGHDCPKRSGECRISCIEFKLWREEKDKEDKIIREKKTNNMRYREYKSERFARCFGG